MSFSRRQEKQVNESGYAYAKGKSQSKDHSTGSDEKPKRPYLTSEIRQERMKSISEQISSIEETISLLEKQKHQYVSTNKFLQAAELNNLMVEKRSSKSKLQEELSKLSMASSQVARHKKRKSAKEPLKPKAKVKKTANFFKSSKPKPATVDEESAYEGDMDILSQSSDEENPPKGSKDSNKEESRMSNEKDNNILLPS